MEKDRWSDEPWIHEWVAIEGDALDMKMAKNEDGEFDETVYSIYENPFEAGTALMCETATDGESHPKATATWRPEIPERGEYAVYVSYRSFANSTTDAVYTVHHLGGVREFHVNQRMAGGTWVYLGTFTFAAGDEGFVRLTNQSTAAGLVSADAAKFGGGIGKIQGIVVGVKEDSVDDSSEQAARSPFAPRPPKKNNKK